MLGLVRTIISALKIEAEATGGGGEVDCFGGNVEGTSEGDALDGVSQVVLKHMVMACLRGESGGCSVCCLNAWIAMCDWWRRQRRRRRQQQRSKQQQHNRCTNNTEQQ